MSGSKPQLKKKVCACVLGTLVFYERCLLDLCMFDGFLNPSLCTEELGWGVSSFSEGTGAC